MLVINSFKNHYLRWRHSCVYFKAHTNECKTGLPCLEFLLRPADFFLDHELMPKQDSFHSRSDKTLTARVVCAQDRLHTRSTLVSSAHAQHDTCVQCAGAGGRRVTSGPLEAQKGQRVRGDHSNWFPRLKAWNLHFLALRKRLVIGELINRLLFAVAFLTFHTRPFCFLYSNRLPNDCEVMK